jgi:hypothetical protein
MCSANPKDEVADDDWLDDPFVTFTEWASEADDRAYADL